MNNLLKAELLQGDYSVTLRMEHSGKMYKMIQRCKVEKARCNRLIGKQLKEIKAEMDIEREYPIGIKEEPHEQKLKNFAWKMWCDGRESHEMYGNILNNKEFETGAFEMAFKENIKDALIK